MDYEVLGDDVIHFPRMLENCEEFVDFFESTTSKAIPEWTPWMSGGDDHHDVDQYGEIKFIDRASIDLDPDPLRLKITSEIERHDKVVVEAFLEYLKVIGTSAVSIQKITEKVLSDRPPNFTLKKYHEGKSLGPHPDWGEASPAVFTVAVYLSDDYRGGELTFPELGESISLTAGSVVVFPSKFMHGSEEIVGGVKYLTNEIIFIDVELLDGRNVYA